MKNVYVALAAAQKEFPPLKKDAVNPHFKSKYADLAGVMDAVLPACNKHGLCIWHTTSMMPDNKLAMRTVLTHGESDTMIVCDVPLMPTKNDMQGMKSAVTYAKRIGVESVTGIAATDDDDGNAASEPARTISERVFSWNDKFNKNDNFHLRKLADVLRQKGVAPEHQQKISEALNGQTFMSLSDILKDFS